jgi:hypothetical protein
VGMWVLFHARDSAGPEKWASILQNAALCWLL